MLLAQSQTADLTGLTLVSLRRVRVLMRGQAVEAAGPGDTLVDYQMAMGVGCVSSGRHRAGLKPLKWLERLCSLL